MYIFRKISIPRQYLLKATAVIVTLLLSYSLLSNYFDLIINGSLVSTINSLGLSAFYIFIPYILIIMCDSTGWLICFGSKKTQLWLSRLFIIRLATETLQTSLPGGAAYAEMVRPYLLKRHFDIDLPKSIAVNIITKINILIAQVIFLLCGIFIFIISFRDNTSSALLPDYVIYLSLSILIPIPILLAYLLYKKNLLLHIVNVLERISHASKFLKKIRQPMVDINNAVSVFAKYNKQSLLYTISLFLITWLLMSFESLVILKVLRIDAGIFQAIMIESLISVVRILFFFIPGALGPQDFGIVLLFNIAGLPDPAANAILFVVLRRVKEFFWIAVGYFLLFILGVKPNKLIKNKKIEPKLANQNL